MWGGAAQPSIQEIATAPKGLAMTNRYVYVPVVTVQRSLRFGRPHRAAPTDTIKRSDNLKIEKAGEGMFLLRRRVFEGWTIWRKMNNFAVLYDLCIDFRRISSYHKDAMIFIQYPGLCSAVI